jgi:5-formyltetrahydrofolate cyclo-ligase
MTSSASFNSGSVDDSVRQEKQELRKTLRAALRGLSVDEIGAQSAQVWTRVFELPIFQAANSVGLFLSMPQSEINTDLVLQHCVQSGKKIYVPEVGKNFELCDMELREVLLEKDSIPSDGMFHKAWPKNKWEIPEPPPGMPVVVAKPGDIDVLIVPGLGFDRSRNRLGQGKGYYDRFIAKMTSDGNELPLVAVALTPQLVDGSIPVASYDRRMDMIVLPEEIISE